MNLCPPQWYQLVKIWALAHGLSAVTWIHVDATVGLLPFPCADTFFVAFYDFDNKNLI